MANYNIVVDTSNFRPYDYNLAYRAIQDYNRGYGESQAVYDKISQTLGDLASAVEGSTRAKALYDEYRDRFNIAADEFSRGMNINTARELGQLRSLYGTKIRQLEKANEARVKAAEFLRAKNKDDDYFHENIGSLDEWMDDPNRQVRGYSGNRLTTEVVAMMGSVAKSMKQLNADGRLDSYNKKWIETGGFSPERISQAISQLQIGGIDSVEDPIIKGVLRNVASSSGMDEWADADTLQKRNEYMARGLYGGIGETKIGHYADDEANANLQLQKQLQLENQKREWAKQDAEQKMRQQELLNNRTQPKALRHTNEISQANKDIEKFKEDGFIQELPDGSLRFTDKGINELNRKGNNNKGMSPLIAGITNQPSYSGRFGGSGKYTALKNFVDSQLTKQEQEALTKAGIPLIEGIRQRNQQGAYDIYHSTEFDRPLDPTYGKQYLEQMISNGQLSELEIAEDWDKDKGMWKSTSTMNVSDLKDWHVSNVRYSQYGNTVILSKEGETPIRIKIPDSLNREVQKDVIGFAKAIADLTEIKTAARESGKLPLLDSEGTIVRDESGKIKYTNRRATEADIAAFDKQITEARGMMDYFGAQIVRLHKSKTEEE